MKWPGLTGDIACTVMILACTTLDLTMNQIRLRCFSGSRAAKIRNTPRVV